LAMHGWEWWFKTDAGLFARIGIGAGIFAILAGVDLARRGRRATRWREYLFLLVTVGAAMLYGVVNDAVASQISWEYFYYGKGLDQQLGPQVPPDPAALQWAACGVGARATWSAGLVIGVVLLIANNPRPKRMRLPYRTLASVLAFILLVTAGFAALGAVAGSRGYLNWTNADVAAIAAEGLFRPGRFLCAYGINCGGYAGGALALAGGAAWIVRRRNALSVTGGENVGADELS